MKFYGLTDIGKSRKENQDKIYLPTEEDELQYFILADGMGGANGGAVASTAAIEVVKDYITQNIEQVDFEEVTLESLIKRSNQHCQSFYL